MIAPINSSSNVQLPVLAAAACVWVTNTGGSPITVTPPAGCEFAGIGSSTSLPAGKQLFCQRLGGGAYFIRHA
jgi:hypothetical protein